MGAAPSPAGAPAAPASAPRIGLPQLSPGSPQWHSASAERPAVARPADAARLQAPAAGPGQRAPFAGAAAAAARARQGLDAARGGTAGPPGRGAPGAWGLPPDPADAARSGWRELPGKCEPWMRVDGRTVHNARPVLGGLVRAGLLARGQALHYAAARGAPAGALGSVVRARPGPRPAPASTGGSRAAAVPCPRVSAGVSQDSRRARRPHNMAARAFAS